MTDSLRGRLLIAGPQLLDYFRRTVVLVLEHTEDGAMGVVLNRVSETAVAEVVPRLAGLAGPEALVRMGGPVSPTSVVALGDFADPERAGTPLFGSLGVLDPEGPDPDLRRLMVYAGYAGWAPAQLDSELDEGAWVVADARVDDPWHDGDLWPHVLKRMGGSYALMATMPVDPSMN